MLVGLLVRRGNDLSSQTPSCIDHVGCAVPRSIASGTISDARNVTSFSAPNVKAPNHIASIEKRTVRRVMVRIIPFICVLYIVAFLDRINITFAALKMNAELGATSQQYGLLVGIFFLGYFVFEIPSNLLLHRVGARIWIARILVSWGLIAALTGLAQNVGHLYGLRFALGLAEAGFAPGMMLYLTYWFPRRSRAQAVGVYLLGMPVATIIGAPLSGLILDHVSWFGLSSWRWLLILEGVPAIVLGFATYFLLPNRPEGASFLAPEERTWLVTRLAEEADDARRHGTGSPLAALANAQVWTLTTIYFGILTGLYAFTFWAPLLVKSLVHGSANTAVGFLVMVPSVVGALAMVLLSRHSDQRNERRYHVAIPVAIAGIALVSLGVGSDSLTFTLMLLCVTAVGVYGFFGPFWAIPGAFLGGYGAAAGLALINAIGNLAGFVAPYTIGALAQHAGSPYPGLAVAGLAMLVAAGLVTQLPTHFGQPAPA